MTDQQSPAIKEWAVVDESCNCKRIVRHEEIARQMLDDIERVFPNSAGPFHLEHRLVSRWARV